MRLLMLPGMDGGGALLAPFASALPSWIAPSVVTYPPESALGYDALEASVRARLNRSNEPAALLAESFSGPLAIRIGAAPPPALRALVLVATFTHSPLGAVRVRREGRLDREARDRRSWWPHVAPPRALLRRTLIAPDSSDALARAVQAAVRRTSPSVLAHRLRAALAVDVRAELDRVAMPILVLEGARDRLLRGRTRWPTPHVVILDTPHLVLASAPREAAAHVARFLAANSPDPVR